MQPFQVPRGSVALCKDAIRRMRRGFRNHTRFDLDDAGQSLRTVIYHLHLYSLEILEDHSPGTCGYCLLIRETGPSRDSGEAEGSP